MFTIVMLVIAVLFAAGIVIMKKKTGPADIIGMIIASLMLFVVGIGGLYAFAGHAFMADQVAARIGWPPGSPFQFEVAVANLAFAILGLLSLHFTGGFRLATATGYAVFLMGAAAGHIRDIVTKGNYSAYNAGAFLVIGDIIMPAALLALVVVHWKLRQKSKRALAPVSSLR